MTIRILVLLTVWIAGAAAMYLCMTPLAPTAAAADNPSYALQPGEYELTVEGASPLKRRPTRKGALLLRKWVASDEVPPDLYPLYGWTDVDLKDMGFPLDASKPPPDSQDPNNPGVLVFVAPPRYDGLFESFKVHQASGAPVLLIGTVGNSGATRRGGRDGGGAGLFVQGREGRCLRGHWDSVGPFKGGTGRFKVCPSASAQPDGSAGQRNGTK
jgi:hypothetical protein